ncbi:MAG TPA: hypothetical protein VFT34_18560 [Verrucomicrobiae bacterium]|nr:hypothetical protein [Verrucomicrobiae bacterium]
MTRSKLILAGLAVVAALVVSVLLQLRLQSRLSQKAAASHHQEVQLAELLAEGQRLSNLLAQATNRSASPEGLMVESTSRLRAEAEALRHQTNQLARQLAEQLRLADQLAAARLRAGVRAYAAGDSNLLAQNKELGITFADGPRATGKLNDARALTAALRKYSDERAGEFPVNLDQVALYLPKTLEPDSSPWANAPLTGTNDFEIVYQGSQNDLSNIPPRRVALLRERQPWLTPQGKWARVYGYADGAAGIVESEDNFQSWDAQHIIPPPNARR